MGQQQRKLPEARLIGLKGLLSDLEFKILADTIYIGRVTGNDIVLNDTSVSSQHSKINFENGNFIISDLDSKNGIKINGKEVTKKVLRNGDKLKIGGTTFRFVYKPLPQEQRQGTKTSKSETNLVRLASYAIGVFIVFMLLIKLLATNTTSNISVLTPQGNNVYIDLNNLSESTPNYSNTRNGNNLKSAEQHYRKGIISYDSKQFRSAVGEFKQALSMVPENNLYKKSLKSALNELNKEIDYHVRQGKVNSTHLKYSDAIKEWEYALFLIGDKKLKQYKKIQNEIAVVKKRLEKHQE